MSPFLKRCVVALTLALSAVAGVRLLARAPVTIKLSTFAPTNSPWHLALLEMANAWDKATEGRVKLIVYPSGTQGTEPTVVKMMRPPASQLHIQRRRDLRSLFSSRLFCANEPTATRIVIITRLNFFTDLYFE